jgi:hypothetical protein
MADGMSSTVWRLVLSSCMCMSLIVDEGQYCVELAFYGVRALASTAAVCDQQAVADSMLDFAKSLPNNATLVHLTGIYAQQPPSSSDGRAVLYCQNPPINTELRGVYHCQSADYDLTTFTGGVAIGAVGTIPYGLRAAVTPPGSCPDHSGPVPSGAYLQDASITSSKQVLSGQASGRRQRKARKSHRLAKRDDEDGGGAPQPPAEDAATTTPTATMSSDPGIPSDLASQPGPTDIPPLNNAASSEPTPSSSTTDANATTTDTSASSPVPTQTNAIVDPNQSTASFNGTAT